MAAIPLAVPFAPAALEGIGAAAAAGLAFTLIPVAVGAVGYLAYEAYNYSQQPPPPRSPSPPRRSPSPPPRTVVIIAMKGRVKRNLKEAQKTNPPDVIVPPSANAWGAMENQTRQMVEMKLKDQHVWCGHFKSGPPPNNRMNESAIDKMNKNPPDVISHRGVPPSGSKAAVAYSAHSRQWILAWHVPLPSSSSSANKIYVEYGPERPIDWNVIEKRLDASSKTSECDGGYAEITDGADARIGAAFWE